jgi:hypothetical protein
MLDLEFGDVEFALASAEETDAGSMLREPDSQTFSYSTPSAGDQHRRMLQ